MTRKSLFVPLWSCVLTVCVAASAHAADRGAQVVRNLRGLDAYMQQLLRDWNGVGVGVGVVVDGKLVLARGYGYRDYGKKLPITERTLFPIASNTKLFAAVSAGFLVEEGKLEWDTPIRKSVPSIVFHDDRLNDSVTLRDMLSHRTGITRHDTIWYKSDLTADQLCERLRYLEPAAPLRQTYLYNNMMYAGVGCIVARVSGKPWPQYVREKILQPLEMNDTVLSIREMRERPDYAVGYTERRESGELYQIPYYEDAGGLAPAGAIVSNIHDLSHWLIALMEDGRYAGRQVLPAGVLKATLEPSIARPNTSGETRGWWELINSAYGMGRNTASYRGHLITFHGGDLPAFHSQISYMPQERIGVIVFVIGDHMRQLYSPISYNIYEQALGLSETPWSKRLLEVRRKQKEADKEARSKAGAARAAGTTPSHALADYVGEYAHEAYGVLKIGLDAGKLQFDFHTLRFPMEHFHYDRFDTPDDEEEGRWSVNFSTSPQGDIDRATLSLDEAEATFVRKPPTLDAQVLERLAGSYATATGTLFRIGVRPGSRLMLLSPGQLPLELVPYKGLTFRSPRFSDVTYEFIESDGRIIGLKQTDPNGEHVSDRK